MSFFLKKVDVKLLVSIVVFCAFILISRQIVQGLKFGPVEPAESAPHGDKKEKVSPAFTDIPFQKDTGAEVSGIAESSPPLALGGAYVAIILDDLGINYRLANEFMELGIDFTLAILPNRTYSAKIADNAIDRGYEVMLHLPMEPYNYQENDPGEDALLLDMSDDEIKARITEMLDQMPGVSGVNNHMGSRFTENVDKMSVVMDVIGRRGLYFLDSKTSENSCGTDVARRYGVPNARRMVFLDNDKGNDNILKQVDEVIKLSKKSGYAVAICHPYPETILALGNIKDILEKNGVTIMKLSEIINLIPDKTKKRREILSSKRLSTKKQLAK